MDDAGCCHAWAGLLPEEEQGSGRWGLGVSERREMGSVPLRYGRLTGHGPFPSMGWKVAPRPSFIFFVLSICFF
jgi:hypothetical protein